MSQPSQFQMDSLTLMLNVKTQEVKQNLCDTNDQLQTYSLELTIVYNYSIVDLEEPKKGVGYSQQATS